MERSLPQRGKFYEVSSLISQLAPRFIVEVVDSDGHGKVILKRPNGNVPFMVTEDQWERMHPEDCDDTTGEAGMNQPTVCAIMLTADRPALATRAVECFRAQTYENKRLLVLDTGAELWERRQFQFPDDVLWWWDEKRGRTVGQLRNDVISLRIQPEIIIHWDDDDYSHPNRIAEQVALLQATGADAVGYREMLFWREHAAPGNQINGTGEAWLYRMSNPRYALGTSLCYWHKTWERMPFPSKSRGEDTVWFDGGVNQIGVSSVPALHAPDKPVMVARIHAGNTSGAYRPDVMRESGEWTRVPQWDSYCAEVMERFRYAAITTLSSTP